jgi:hypothetical protein
VTSTEKPRFLVHIAHRTEISPQNFEVSVLSDIIFGHLKHAKMKVGDWTETPTCDQNYGNLVWIAKDSGKASVGEQVARRICELLSKVNG